MRRRRASVCMRALCVILMLGAARTAAAAAFGGKVTFAGLPLPGATVTLMQGGKKLVAITDLEGVFDFPDAAEGPSALQIEMTCFATLHRDLHVTASAQPAAWEMKLLSLEQIRAELKPVSGALAEVARTLTPASRKSEEKPLEAATVQDDVSGRAADGLLINGSVNNAAVSRFTLSPVFGNNRVGGKGLYTGSVGVVLDNSALDARPYSLSGLDTSKNAYNRATVVFTLGGPLRIPHLLRRGPTFFVAYQGTRDREPRTEAALFPTLAERMGDLSQDLDAYGHAVPITNPATGLPFPGDVPVSAQAAALLKLYPVPNLAGNTRYNYQISVPGSMHGDATQLRLSQAIRTKDQVFGDFALQSLRTSDANVFSFVDRTDLLGMNAGINWAHRFSQRKGLTVGYRFSRLATRAKPYWQNRENISAEAGIAGNNQDPYNWGPPTLVFAGGITTLRDAQSSFNRNRADALTASMELSRKRHNLSFGGSFGRQENNIFAQGNPRGTLTFTGEATRGIVAGVGTRGSDFADFLLGVPDASALVTGNPDKYLRQSVYSAFVTDDWRLLPQFTLNAGARWEYGSPISELRDRLVNLDVAPGFTAVAPVLASDPAGPLTGQRFPASLIRPDRSHVQPRVGLSWRPFAASTVLIRAGYGVYADTSVYATMALQLAQQAPFSRSLVAQNSAACPLTLSNPFNPCNTLTPDTFGVDPGFRVGYAQNWQLAIQRDLRGSLQVTATYLGIKGTHGTQQFLPNTYPAGASNGCVACPSGFAYLASGGNSTRQAGQVQVRRRLHNGLAASVDYIYSKSIDDDAALGGQGPVTPGLSAQGATITNLSIAQDWRNLRAERGPSSFDQRHVLNAQAEYTSGMGAGGGSLMRGRAGTLLKEWTVQTQISVGSGLPETPILLQPGSGSGFTGTLRPDVTGAPVYAAAPGFFLNRNAFRAPVSGHYGDAGRNSILGPGRFSLNASMARTFRVRDRLSLDLRVDAANLLNHVTYTGWIANVESTQFGLPLAANPMRSLQTTLRMRF